MRVSSVAALLWTIAISLLLCEVLVRAATMPHQFLDPASERYWTTLLQRRLPELSASSHDRATVFDLQLGWRMAPGYSKAGVSHDAQGFRTTPSGGASERTVLAIGDSFTYGLGVRDEETYSAYLAQLAGVDVVNAGVNAYGVDQALLMWELHGRQHGPDVVILGYFVDDFLRNGVGVRDGPKPHFARREPGGDFELRGVPVPVPARWGSIDALSPGWSLRTVDAVRWACRRVARASGFRPDEELERMSDLNRYLLQRLDSSTRQEGAELIVLIIGHCYDGAPEHQWVEDTIEEACDDFGLTCINVAAAMRGRQRHRYYGNNCHFSPEGHRFTASLVGDELNGR